MLDKFIQAKQKEISGLEEYGVAEQPLQNYRDSRPCFSKSLRSSTPGAIIAEYKRASPSQGEINLDISPREVGEIYQQGGAAAISVLTERKYFRSQLDYLFEFHQFGLPLLRKDFIFHPLQIKQTATTPASALLLIARIFRDSTLQGPNAGKKGKSGTAPLQDCIKYSRDLGLEPVVEIFNQRDLEFARKAGADIIQVNNRDLETLKVDLETSRRLILEKEPGELWIAASGLASAQNIREAFDLGYQACLIGTSIMSSTAPAEKLREFRGQNNRFELMSDTHHREHRGNEERSVFCSLCDLCGLCGKKTDNQKGIKPERLSKGVKC